MANTEGPTGIAPLARAATLTAALLVIPAAARAQSVDGDSVVYVLAPASQLDVRTGKAGLLGFAGHAHLIRAREFSGRVIYRPAAPGASRVEIIIETAGLAVLTPPDTEEIRKVTAAMRAEVLDVAQYPEIRFTSRHLQLHDGRGERQLQLTGALTIKGQTREVPIEGQVELGPDTLRVVTSFAVNQTDFGIRPYRGGPGGTVRVADKVTFAIKAVAIRQGS